jgi:hypothetical protein
MPRSPDEAVDVTVSLDRRIYDELATWTRSVVNEEPADFLQLFTNALMTDQALREQIAGTYLGGA